MQPHKVYSRAMNRGDAARIVAELGDRSGRELPRRWCRPPGNSTNLFTGGLSHLMKRKLEMLAPDSVKQILTILTLILISSIFAHAQDVDDVGRYLPRYDSAPSCKLTGQLYLDTVLGRPRLCSVVGSPGTWNMHSYVQVSTPGGSDTQVQFNDSGVFGGDAGLIYNKTTDTLIAGTFSSPKNTQGEAFGSSTAASTFNKVSLFGYGATAGLDEATVFGYNAVGNSTGWGGSGWTYGGPPTLFGSQARGSGVAVGYKAQALNYEAIAIGPQAQATKLATIAIGDGARAIPTGGGNEIVMGDVAFAKGNINYFIGGGAGIINDFVSCWACQGSSASYTVDVSTASHQGYLGWYMPSSTYFSAGQGLYNDWWLGGPYKAAIPHAITLNITGGEGTNVAGVDFTIQGSRATGNAAGGNIIFATSTRGASGTALEPLVNRLKVDSAGGVDLINGSVLKIAGVPVLSSTFLNVNQGTLVGASTPFIGHTATWNNVSTTFTNFLSNVTDTNSSSSSLLMDLQVGGVSKFKVDKNGAATATNLTSSGNLTSVFGVIAGAGSPLWFNGRARIRSDGDGLLRLGNSVDLDFTRLMFGGKTSSFNAIGRDAVNGFTLQSAAGTSTWNDPSTANGGTVANRYLLGIAAPTLSSTGTTVTYTTASSFYIGGAPTAGTNVTIGTPYALNVATGNTFLAGLTLDATITPEGITGNQTINKPSGTVNIGAMETSVSVNNALVTANSILSIIPRTNDPSCRIANYVPAAGSFTINMTAACTAETSIGFAILHQ